MWNPVGVRINSYSYTWGAPQSGDPRLCCETRSGLNHTISLQIILHDLALWDSLALLFFDPGAVLLKLRVLPGLEARHIVCRWRDGLLI